MANKTYTAASFSAGIGTTTYAYRAKGFQILYGTEAQDTERAIFRANFPDATHDNTDARWFNNRKAKGRADLLAKIGLPASDTLDLLDFTAHLTAADKKSNTPANLFDFFALATSLSPKVAVAYVPPNLVANENLDRFNKSLDFLRYKTIAEDQRERNYFVFCRLVDASLYGSAVTKSYGVVIAVHKDQAVKARVKTDADLEFAFPLPQQQSQQTVRQILGNVIGQSAERDYWTKQAHRSKLLWAARKQLPKEPPKVTTLASLGPRVVTDCGYPKSRGEKVIRAAWDRPCPNLDLYKGNKLGDNGCLHPAEDRLFSAKEVSALIGFPPEFNVKANESDKPRLMAQAIPPQIGNVVADTALVILQAHIKRPKALSPRELRIRHAETLVSNDDEIKTYISELDLGDSAAKTLKGKPPTPKDYDYLFDADVIGKDFVVYGPFDATIGRRPIIGAVKRKVFDGPSHSEAVTAIRAIQQKSEVRLDESPQKISSRTIKNLEDRGRKYRLINEDRSYELWVEPKDGKKGHWDRPRSDPISSSTYGWMPDKNTKLPKFGNAGVTSEDVKVSFNALAKRCDSVYYRLANDDHKKQYTFLNSRILREHRLGGSVFTTLAVNRYGDDMPAMNYHIDSGDHNSGLTTIAVFNEGAYDGGYFVIPQYRCAFRVGDGDVFVANSRKVHGVQELEGSGRRLSVVCYTKTTLAYKENTDQAYPPTSERPNFKWNSYKVAVMVSPDGEHPRPIKIFKYLKQQKIDPRRVTLFVPDEKLAALYGAPANKPYQLRLGEKLTELKSMGWNNKRITEWLDKEGYEALRKEQTPPNRKATKPSHYGDQISAIHPSDFYPANTPIVYLRDNAEGLFGITRSPKDPVLSVEAFEQRVIRRGFDACREHSAYLWGISVNGDPDNQDETLDKSISIRSFHPVSTCVGVVNRPALAIRYAPNENASYDLGISHFKKDGRTVRFDYITDALPYVTIPTGKAIKGVKDEDIPPFYVPQSRATKTARLHRKVLAIDGLPATGKSTLMKAFLKQSGTWETVKPAKGLKALYNKGLDCYILGEYVDGEKFPGTDRLDMAIQPVALNFLSETKSHVIFEGDRLFNFSFLEALDHLGASLQILEIVSSAEVLKARHKKRKDNQDDKFLKAKQTKIRNICGSPTFFSRVKTMENNTDHDQAQIIQEMKTHFGIG
jgi:site-specific DNA-cytosine methylase